MYLEKANNTVHLIFRDWLFAVTDLKEVENMYQILFFNWLAYIKGRDT
jgi:hypothetical protein